MNRFGIVRPSLSLPQLFLLGILVCTSWSTCRAADVLVVAGNTTPQVLTQVRMAADYYGVGMKVVAADSRAQMQTVLEIMAEPNITGVVLHAGNLGQFDRAVVFSALRRGSATIPLFV